MKIASSWKLLAFVLPLLLYLFLSYWPIIRSYQTAPPDRYYWGSVDYAIDTVGNMTTVREGYLGHWQRFSKHTTTIEGKASFLKFEYVAIGQLARLFRIDPLVLFHTSKFIVSLSLLAVLWIMVKMIFSGWIERMIAWVLVLFSTGVTEPWKEWLSRMMDHLPGDVMVFSRLTTAAHHYLLGSLFSLLSIWFLARAIDRKHDRYAAFLSFVFGALATFVYGPAAILLITSVGLYAFCRILRRPKLLRERTLGLVFFYIVVAAVPLVYIRYVSQFWDYSAFAATEKLAPFDIDLVGYFLVVGGIYILAVLGVRKALQTGKTLVLLLLPWLIVHPVGVFLVSPLIGMNRSRLFFTPYFAVFAILAVYGIVTISRAIARWREGIGKLVPWIILSLVLLPSYISYAASYQDLDVCFCNIPFYDYGYPKRSTMEAIWWLRDHTREDDIVLSGLYTGALIPAFAGNRVYTSWWMRLTQTPNFPDVERTMYRFFASDMTEDEARSLVSSQNIEYVFLSDEEQQYGQGKTALDYLFLRQVYQSENTRIYAVRK